MLYNIEEVAKIFNVTVRTIHRWKDEKGLKHFHVGGVLRFSDENIEEFKKLHAQEGLKDEPILSEEVKAG
jgi:excisionase family DNA binding protein